VWPAYEQTTVGVRFGDPAVIDLARLHEPATRALLARAVLMVDAADGESSTTAGPRSTAQAPVNHAATAAPVDTAKAPGEHPTTGRTCPPAQRPLTVAVRAAGRHREHAKGVTRNA
jgi:hypothetical protein